MNSSTITRCCPAMLATLPYDTLYTNHCLLGEWTFSTDTPSLYLGIEGVLGAAPTLWHCVPVLVGCPLYNEASVLADLKHCSSTAVVRDYSYYMRLFLIRFAKFWLQRYKKNCRLSHKRTKICNMMMQKNSFCSIWNKNWLVLQMVCLDAYIFKMGMAQPIP